MHISARALSGAVAAALLSASPSIASDKTDIMATVKQFDDDINKGDIKSATALCGAQAIVIDDFAPHVWQGASACQDWATALDAFEKKTGISGDVVTLGKPWHVAVTGDRGYAVYPTTYAYKLNGKPVMERGVMTLAMQKVAAGWRIAGWAWAQR